MTGEPRFTVAARALRQFGAELITSDEVALNELIKNAFDAKSKRVRIDINAPTDPHVLLAIKDKLEHDVLSPAAARDQLSHALTPRLSTEERHDLLDGLFEGEPSAAEVVQRLQAFRESEFWIEVTDTGVGMSREQLQTEFLTIGTPNKWLKKQEGKATSLLGEKGIGRLSMMRLARHAHVASKREGDSTWHQIRFDWALFDDASKNLEDIPISIVRLPAKTPSLGSGTTIRLFDLNSVWNAEKVEQFIHGYLRRLQDPFRTTTRPYPIDVYFNGERQSIPSIYAWFIAAAQFKASFEFHTSPHSSAVALRRRIRWRHAQSDELREWTMQSLVTELSVTPETLRRIGAFDANLLWFNRQLLTSDDIEHSPKEIKDELNIWCGGFAIYRDGFRVGRTGGMDDDWLQMDEKALRSQGFTLNRYQAVGSLRINSQENPRLIDAANRQSLVSCPEYEALRDLFADIIVKDLRSHISSVQTATTNATIERDAGEQSLRQVEQDFRKVLRQVDGLAKETPKGELRTKLMEVRTSLNEHAENVKIFRKAVEMAQETRVELLELAGVGLVVEIVIHELARLTDRTNELLNEIGERGDATGIGKIIENLREQIKATNKRIRTVDALSPSGRHRKEEFDLVAFVDSILSGYEARFSRHGISATLLVDGKKARKVCTVHMVRGLVAQVLENLIANSVYWLQQGLMPGADQRELVVEIDSKAQTVTVSDDGPGIDPRHRIDVFKPYFSTKKKGKGLGLYIAGELARYHRGSLYLDEAAEADGRLRHFVLELPKP